MHEITLGFTPDPDDAFAVYALAHGKTPTGSLDIRLVHEPIDVLNDLAARRAIDATAISSAFYPWIRESYAILRSGASVGRGYGPALVARPPLEAGDLAGRRVAVPGSLTTTGASLLRLFFPDALPQAMPFRDVHDAVVSGAVDAGVLIHEELLRGGAGGPRRIACLGERWTRLAGLPLPVGLVVARRDLPQGARRDLARAVRRSVQYALDHPAEAFAWAARFGHSPTRDLAWRFTTMFTNADTLRFGDDCEAGLRRLFDCLAAAGLAPAVDRIDFIEGDAPAADGLAPRRARRDAGMATSAELA